jgi:hypothetical protein
MSYSVERLIELWNDEDGTKLEVGQDRDSLGLVEIREIGRDGKSVARITMERELAIKLLDALHEYCTDDRNFT